MAGIFHNTSTARYLIQPLHSILKSAQSTSASSFGVMNRAALSYQKLQIYDNSNRCGMYKIPRCGKHTCRRPPNGYNRSKETDEFTKNCEAGRAQNPRCSGKHRIGFKPTKPLTALEMLFYKKECCPPCLPELPRFDQMYYKIRKLGDRCYTPSWTECPKPRIIPKLVCCYDTTPFEFPRRPKCKRPPTACTLDLIKSKLNICNKGGDPNCVKVKSPFCCPARNPPSCVRERQPLCIERIKTPAPSFSECNIPVNPLKASECRCLGRVYACELYKVIDYNKC